MYVRWSRAPALLVVVVAAAEKGIAKSAIEESRVAGDEAARGPRWPGRFGGHDHEAR